MNYASKELYDTYKKLTNLITKYDENLNLGMRDENFSHMAGILLKDLHSASYKTGMMEVWMEIDKIQELINGEEGYMDDKILLECLIRCKSFIERNLTKRSKVYICSRNMDEFKDVIRSLELEGFDVIAREDDEDTIDRIYTLLPEIIVIDNDSNNNGLTLFNAIREDGPIASIPVVFTGYKNEETKIEILLLGALDYLEKPLVAMELFIKLKNFMEISKNLSRNTVYDIKTGVYSRKHGREIAKKQFELAKKNKTRFTMLLVDIDKMTEINIKLGKSKGNDVIRDFVEVFKEQISNTNLIYRYSGDKFAVIIFDLEVKDIIVLTREVKQRLVDVSTKYGVDLGFTGGIAILNDEVNAYEDLIMLAEESLNKGKHSQRGEVYIHSSSLEGKQKKNILIVDEDPIILSILSSRYSNKGYGVLTSQNGLEALGLLDENNIDLIITDLIVPGITGNEIIKRIKDKKPSVRILILSSQRGENYIDLALKSGGDEYVVKPFSPVELDLRIQRLIG